MHAPPIIDSGTELDAEHPIRVLPHQFIFQARNVKQD